MKIKIIDYTTLGEKENTIYFRMRVSNGKTSHTEVVPCTCAKKLFAKGDFTPYVVKVMPKALVEHYYPKSTEVINAYLKALQLMGSMHIEGKDNNWVYQERLEDLQSVISVFEQMDSRDKAIVDLYLQVRSALESFVDGIDKEALKACRLKAKQEKQAEKESKKKAKKSKKSNESISQAL